MDKYTSFEMFMIEVVNTANSISDLNHLFDVKYKELIGNLIKIIEKGWWAFVSFCVLLAIGPFGFSIALGSFLLTPPGLIIGAIFGFAVAFTIRQIYKNRELPLVIKRIGSKYEKKWKDANGNATQIDNLFKDAVKDLLNSGKHSPSISALNRWMQLYENY